MRVTRFSAALLVLALLVGACGSDDPSTGPTDPSGPSEPGSPGGDGDGDGELEPFVFSLASSAFVAGLAWVWVGSHPDVGIYQDEGIDLQMVGSQGAPDCVQQLVAGRVDLCMLAQDPVLNRAAEEGDHLPITFIYNYTYKVTNELAVLPDSDVTSIEQLEGGTIGVNAIGHDTYNFAQRVFQAIGIDPDNQEYLAVGQGGPAVTALYNGDIDALVAYDIEWAIYDSLDMPVRVLPQPPAISEVRGGPILAVRTEDVEQRRDWLVRTMRSVAKSTLFAISNPEATLRLHWDMYPESRPQGELTDDVMAAQLAIVGARLPSIDPRNFDYVDNWGEFNADGWVAYVENILRHDVPGDVDPADFYTNDLIPEINDFDEAEIEEFARDFVYTE